MKVVLLAYIINNSMHIEGPFNISKWIPRRGRLPPSVAKPYNMTTNLYLLAVNDLNSHNKQYKILLTELSSLMPLIRLQLLKKSVDL